MKNTKIGVEYANSIDNLRLKSIGYHHDHCGKLYFGKIKDLPSKFNHFRKKQWNYIFIYEEDIPYKL